MANKVHPAVSSTPIQLGRGQNRPSLNRDSSCKVMPFHLAMLSVNFSWKNRKRTVVNSSMLPLSVVAVRVRLAVHAAQKPGLSDVAIPSVARIGMVSARRDRLARMPARMILTFTLQLESTNRLAVGVMS